MMNDKDETKRLIVIKNSYFGESLSNINTIYIIDDMKTLIEISNILPPKGELFYLFLQMWLVSGMIVSYDQ
jgi:hypothetical protein